MSVFVIRRYSAIGSRASRTPSSTDVPEKGNTHTHSWRKTFARALTRFSIIMVGRNRSAVYTLTKSGLAAKTQHLFMYDHAAEMSIAIVYLSRSSRIDETLQRHTHTVACSIKKTTVYLGLSKHIFSINVLEMFV